MTAPAMPERPFLYVGGDPALDLINTVDWTSRGPEQERLQTYEGLIRWAEGAGVIDPAAGRHLRRLGRERPRAAASSLAYAQEVRAALHDLFRAVAVGEPTGAPLARFNRLLAGALGALELAPGEGRSGYRWRWQGERSDARALLWPVLWSAADLLRSDEVANLRVCDGDECGWMFVDRSRNGLRRWCQMRSCGTQEKTRRRRQAT
jgi:predicted RNA-binding Zn ribbon-like protein